MKRNVLTLLVMALAALTLDACADSSGDSLTNGSASRSPTPTGSATAAPVEDTTPAAAAAAAAQVTAIGSPEVTSRLHGCGKLTVNSVGDLLQSRGLTGTTGLPKNTQSGKQIFDSGDTAAALGAANYGGRQGEAPFASTSAISKMFDIYTMSSYGAVASDWSAPACPGVKLLDASGKFTKDGISCLIGKPATDQHVAIANDAIANNPTDGAKVATAALLSAAHTCQ
jgi:hypothetical protein